MIYLNQQVKVNGGFEKCRYHIAWCLQKQNCAKITRLKNNKAIVKKKIDSSSSRDGVDKISRLFTEHMY